MLVEVGKRRRRDLIVLEQRGPAPDHPVAISCPESDYLKCVIAQVLDEADRSDWRSAMTPLYLT